MPQDTTRSDRRFNRRPSASGTRSLWHRVRNRQFATNTTNLNKAQREDSTSILTMLTVWLNFEGDGQGAVCKHERNSHTDVRCLKWADSMTVAAAAPCLLSPPSRDIEAAPPLVDTSPRLFWFKWLTSIWTWLGVITRQCYRLQKSWVI